MLHFPINVIPSNSAYNISWADALWNPWTSDPWSFAAPTDSHRTANTLVFPDVGTETECETTPFISPTSVSTATYRVLIGPWCNPFDSRVDPVARHEMWATIRRYPTVIWLLVGQHSDEMLRELPSVWDLGLENVWLGLRVSSRASVQEATLTLRSLPAKTRFLLFEGLSEDPGDLELDDIDWIVYEDPDDGNDWFPSIKLQAMAYGVPVWNSSQPGDRYRELPVQR